LRETQDNIDLTDAIEIHFIELPKLKLEMASYTNPLDRWVVFLKGGWDMELLDRLAKEDPAIGKAKQVLEQMASNPRERELYELRRKAILDRNSALFEAKLEGKLEGKFETARAALLKGADVEFVAEITGLSLDEVQKLKVDNSCPRLFWLHKGTAFYWCNKSGDRPSDLFVHNPVAEAPGPLSISYLFQLNSVKKSRDKLLGYTAVAFFVFFICSNEIDYFKYSNSVNDK
jgi:hypothetical protein